VLKKHAQAGIQQAPLGRVNLRAVTIAALRATAPFFAIDVLKPVPLAGPPSAGSRLGHFPHMVDHHVVLMLRAEHDDIRVRVHSHVVARRPIEEIVSAHGFLAALRVGRGDAAAQDEAPVRALALVAFEPLEYRRGVNARGEGEVLAADHSKAARIAEVLALADRGARDIQLDVDLFLGNSHVFVGKGSSAVYGMSKAAVGQLTKSTAIDYAPYNIRVNCICPGTIDTPMIAPAVDRFHKMSGIPVAQIHEMLKTAQPIQRLGTPEEIGKIVLFLLSDDCAFMTGALVSADGGYTSQ
jgi:hypothetical protein